MKRIKRLIRDILLQLIKPKWQNGNTVKVLIQNNRYFTEDRWNEQIATTGLGKDTFEFVFTSKKFSLIKNFHEADICFLTGYNNYLNTLATKQRILYFPSVGTDFIDRSAFPDSYRIIQPPLYSSQAIAEYCLSMSIVYARGLHHGFSTSKSWNQFPVLQSGFSSLTTKRIGILGVGNIGKTVAKIFSSVSREVVGLDKVIDDSFEYIQTWYKPDQIHEFLRSIDILIITLALNETTKGIIGRKELESLGQDSFLINVSRGKIIIEEELLEALISRKIKGAVLDVFTHEPLPANSKLRRLDNVVITPHIAGNFNLFVSEIQQDFLYQLQEHVS